MPEGKKGFALMTGVLGMPAEYYSFDAGGWHFVDYGWKARAWKGKGLKD